MKYYMKKQLQPMMPWNKDMSMESVSISDADKGDGSPRDGDMIASNPNDQSDMWLVAEKFFNENYIESALDVT